MSPSLRSSTGPPEPPGQAERPMTPFVGLPTDEGPLSSRRQSRLGRRAARDLGIAPVHSPISDAGQLSPLNSPGSPRRKRETDNVEATYGRCGASRRLDAGLAHGKPGQRVQP